MVYRTSSSIQARKDAKRQHLITVASKVFAARGYAGTTVKDIVDEAQAAVGTFYLYFKSKEDIFETLYEEISELIISAVDQATTGADHTLVQRFCRATAASLATYQEYRDLTRILLIEAPGLNPRFRQKHLDKLERSRERMADLFSKLAGKGLIEVPDVTVAALAFDGTFVNVIMSWLHSGQSQKLTDFTAALAIYNLQALRIPYTNEEVHQFVADYYRNPPRPTAPPSDRSSSKEGEES